MKIAGSAEDFFKSVREAHQPFQAAGSTGLVAVGPLAAGALVVGAVMGGSRRDAKLRRIIRQETAKAIKSHQGSGLNFDLFG